MQTKANLTLWVCGVRCRYAGLPQQMSETVILLIANITVRRCNETGCMSRDAIPNLEHQLFPETVL